jgi:hypothetical protein
LLGSVAGVSRKQLRQAGEIATVMKSKGSGDLKRELQAAGGGKAHQGELGRRTAPQLLLHNVGVDKSSGGSIQPGLSSHKQAQATSLEKLQERSRPSIRSDGSNSEHVVNSSVQQRPTTGHQPVRRVLVTPPASQEPERAQGSRVRHPSRPAVEQDPQFLSRHPQHQDDVGRAGWERRDVAQVAPRINNKKRRLSYADWKSSSRNQDS